MATVDDQLDRVFRESFLDIIKGLISHQCTGELRPTKCDPGKRFFMTATGDDPLPEGAESFTETDQALGELTKIMLKKPMGRCNYCRKKTTKRCGACKDVFYCGVGCQRSNWMDHKPKCKHVK